MPESTTGAAPIEAPSAPLPSVRTFQVFPDVPAALQPLLELSTNLWWMWNPDAIELFRRLDRNLWDTEAVYHNPVKLLGSISQAKLSHAAKDDGYLAHLKRVHEAFRDHLSDVGWFARKNPKQTGMKVAYFSAEFGVHESLPIYSGGLGILAGDHLKSASELALPLVGVGLLYRNGYFQQYLSTDGWQQEAYPELDFYTLPIEPMRFTDGSPVQVRVDLPDNAVFCKVWKASIGRIPLYLLDTNLPENAPADRDITSRLYGGGTEMRIKQEIVLGIGGVRALDALGVKPTVFHMNEGHSAFLALERIRILLDNSTLTFDQARQQVMGSNVFTTHTPVPAGIDFFSPELMLKYFSGYFPKLKLDQDGFLALGREDVTNAKQGFSMAVLAIRLADHYNGVSALHGDVSRHMWHNIWPSVPAPEVPIDSVTNGIHIRSWLSPDMGYVFDRYLGDTWLHEPAEHGVWEAASQIPDEELWRAHERGRERLIAWTRQTMRAQFERRGGAYDVDVADELLDPEALTIGFARRFATYKRGALLLRDVERLKRLLDDTRRPIQFVFAGKAHPADQEGKELIKAIVQFARDPAVRRKFVFIENYDINVARYLVQGVDVWLNTPRRPYEASGTSGMKAAANGVLNCSILDGWWVEGYELDHSVGWAIGHGEQYPDAGYQDHVESLALYDLLEKEIIPTFYKRGVDNFPREWIARMKACIKRLAPVFNTNRMVGEYASKFYVPASDRGVKLGADGLSRSIALAQAKDNYRAKWGGIKIVGVHSSGNGHYKVGETMQVEALIDLPDLQPTDVAVQMYVGPLNSQGQIENASILKLDHSRQIAPGRHLFTGQIACATSGRQGFAIRVLPGQTDMVSPFEPGLITWG